MVKNLPAMWETWVWSLGWGDPLEKEMTTHSSILAWRIPWTEEAWGSPWGCKESGMTEQLTHLTVNDIIVYLKYIPSTSVLLVHDRRRTHG